jgi:tetratricopeptide (TPR) repeat protein
MSRSHFVIVCALLAAAAAFAAPQPQQSPPDTSQEAVVFEKLQDLVRFENDGSGIRENTTAVRAQSQAGVQELGQLILGYSSLTETLQVDYVRVRKVDGKVVETSLADAQDFAPEVLQQAPMYSDYRQKHISVANLQAGDVLEYHTVTHIKPLAANEFWYEHRFPRFAAVMDGSLEIDVPKSREIKIKIQPEHKADLTETGDRRIYKWTIKDFMPDRKREREEGFDFDDTPDVQLSTFSDWQQVAHWYAGLQGERVTLSDGVRSRAEELTRGATNAAEKSRRLYDYVARNIRYVSLSFGVGRLQPHAASEVLQNGYGDCKDKHTLLQALLQAEGIKSYPVLIGSSHKLDPDVPSPAQFDHLITAVKFEKDGDFTWLDSTAEVAPYGLIMYQLRNKEALLASGDANAGLHRTVADSPVKNVLSINIDGKYTETGAMDATVELTAQGDSDLPIRMAFREVPQARWQNVLEYLSARAWGLNGDVSDVRIPALEDTTKPFRLTFHFHRDGYFVVPSAGVNFSVLPPLGQAHAKPADKKNPSEPVDVGPAGEQISRVKIQVPSNYTIHVPTDTRMSRDYGEYSSTYNLTKTTLQAERHMTLKVNELPATRRADFESFRSVTSASAEQGLWASITPASASATVTKAKSASTPREMRTAGGAALQRKDFRTAVDLLKRSSDQDSGQKDIWDDLGRAYSGLNQHDDAIAAFRKQIDLDPYHARANGDLAAELQILGKRDEAVEAYQKQAGITPSDQLTHKNLGMLLSEMKRDGEARTELELAASIPPDDPQIKLALAQIYARTGESEKSEALTKSVLGTTSQTAGTDIFAPALTDGINPEEVIHDARGTLDDIGDQFDSGQYDRLGPASFTAMNLVALAWARIGWAKSIEGDLLEAIQFLNSSWLLSDSGTVANRLARVLEKENQKDKARHMYALAVAAGGPETDLSRQQVTRLAANPQAATQEIAEAEGEFVKMRTVKLPGTSPKGTAHFGLVFDASSKPNRVEYLDGDSAVQGVSDKLRSFDYPVKFPDASSIKIIRRATVSCDGGACSALLLPLEGIKP